MVSTLGTTRHLGDPLPAAKRYFSLRQQMAETLTEYAKEIAHLMHADA